jgi:hypothetical protein
MLKDYLLSYNLWRAEDVYYINGRTLQFVLQIQFLRMYAIFQEYSGTLILSFRIVKWLHGFTE